MNPFKLQGSLRRSDEYIPKEIPEHTLIQAVIMRGILDAAGGGYSFCTRHIQNEAITWLKSDSLEEWSYLWCCERINIGRSIAALMTHSVLEQGLRHRFYVKGKRIYKTRKRR